MKIMIANKDDYIKFYAGLIDKINTFEFSEGINDYIISRVNLGNGVQDVSLMDSCVNNLLDEQYAKREYIKLEDIKEINDLIIKLDKEKCRILNDYAEIKSYKIENLDEIKDLIFHINDYQILKKYSLYEVGKMIAEKISGYKMDINVIPFVDFSKLAKEYLFDANIKESFCSYGLLVDTREILDN